MKRRGRVIGIDFIFLTIDSLGAFFSLMAIVAQKIFDPLGGVMYSMCLAIELGIFASHGAWLWRTRGIRVRMKEGGKVWEEWEEAQHWEKRGWKMEWWHRKRRRDADDRVDPGIQDDKA